MRVIAFYFCILSPNWILVSANFRILAPEFICPKDDNSPIMKPENTLILIQVPAGSDLRFTWTVRWKHLEVTSQRFTLMLWKAVRELEKKLNSPQPEPYVYVIEHEGLLRGVEYIFNVSSIDEHQETTTKVFQIDNSQGDQELQNIDGRGDMFSIMLLGGQVTYVDLEYHLEAQLTTCFHTQDYYFVWTVESISSHEIVDVSDITGYRLEIPPHSLLPNTVYDVNCQLVKKSTGGMTAQTGLHFQTLERGLQVYLNVDLLRVSACYPFTLETIALNQDYYNEEVTYEWQCVQGGALCDDFRSENNSTLYLFGLPEVAEYEITVKVTVQDQFANATAKIISVEPILPVIQIEPIPRIINAGSTINLVANVSNVAPACTMTWYFATEDQVMECTHDEPGNCSHGTPIADSITIFSLEENFLTELSDFSNETEWRQVTAEAPAQPGRARMLAECGCSATFECQTRGTVYADVYFKVNDGPKVQDVKITPDTGVALETVFRISTLAAQDPEGPLQYTFYCSINPDLSIEIGSFLEHLAQETILPFVEGGVQIWLEVCDSLGACSKSDPVKVKLSVGEARSIGVLLEDVQAHAARCELKQIKKDVIFAAATYINGEQAQELSSLAAAVTNALKTLDACRDGGTFVTELTDGLALVGYDINTLM